LEYLTTDRLLPTFGATSREFRKRARQEFNRRLQLCHPSLAAAAGRDIDRISWRDWKRFELDESDSRGTGESWQVTVENLADIDVLWEVKKKDGQIVWHGFAPLRRGAPYSWNPRFHDGPEASFNLPRTIFDAPIPTADDDSKFESPSRFFRGLTDYHYWSGRYDCSLQQRTICKLLYGINTYPLLHIHAVMRRRSNGKMITLVSSVNEPNQILGEDYGHDVGEYRVNYYNSENMKYGGDDDDDRVFVKIGFELFCSEEVDRTQEFIQFRTNREPDEGETAGLCFLVGEQGDDEDAEPLVLQAMSSWKWD
jgi:hypothetical protein